MTGGRGGYTVGKLITEKTVRLNDDAWKKLKQIIADINFSNLPSVDNSETGTDGSEWILESNNNGLYHFTVRWTPDLSSNYGKCGLYFLSLTDFNISGDELY